MWEFLWDSLNLEHSPYFHANTILASNLFFLISSKLEISQRGEKREALVFTLQRSKAVCAHGGIQNWKNCMNFFMAHGRLNMDFVGSYCQVFMTGAGLTSVAGITQLPNKWNTESLHLDMTSMLVKTNFQANFHMLIFLPPPPIHLCLNYFF